MNHLGCNLHRIVSEVFALPVPTAVESGFFRRPCNLSDSERLGQNGQSPFCACVVCQFSFLLVQQRFDHAVLFSYDFISGFLGHTLLPSEVVTTLWACQLSGVFSRLEDTGSCGDLRRNKWCLATKDDSHGSPTTRQTRGILALAEWNRQLAHPTISVAPLHRLTNECGHFSGVLRKTSGPEDPPFIIINYYRTCYALEGSL